MKLIKLSILCIVHCTLCIILAACDEVEKDDRFVYVEPPTVNRPLLIEDFTGQNCVNCPNASDALHELQKEYGEDNIIVVAIHSGPFGHETGPAGMNGPRMSLCTETGDAYYNHWKVTSQPGLMFNRDNSYFYSDVNTIPMAAAYYLEEILKPTQLNIDITVTNNQEDEFDIMVDASTDEPVKGKIQLWVLEDDIVDFQLKDGGVEDKAYIHQHVFRTSLTKDILGDEFNLNEKETRHFTCNFTPDAGWKKENLSLVAFIYNEDGVQQLAKEPLMVIEN